ncbi:type II secretion system protein [Blastomonas sp. CACIA14H2]|uniref:type II secretion system protein n=1 Tax=Blastomonas sp. CACIA14H2 TaxID=1419876 RepID=UPI0026B36539
MVPPRSQFGFSLVELSIVLVILGLLTGGILAGQSLIRAAELRAVPTEYNRWITATQTFRDKYFALPGDMPNATSFWTTAGGTGRDTACRTAMRGSTTTGTCNGNGDGILNEVTVIDEAHTYWNHLSRAGLIEGRFIYMPFDATTWVSGRDYPASKLGGNVGWLPCHTDRGNFGRGAKNMFILGQPRWSSFACEFGRTANIRSDEAYNIDIKIDDGLAANGIVTATNSHGEQQGCITGTFPVESISDTYMLSTSRRSCHLYFQFQ